MAYRFPIQQPLDLSGPGSMLLSEYCTSEKATLRTILNYVLRSQSRIPAIQDIPSNEFEKLLKQVSCYNRFISFRIPKVLKKLSVINNKFISAEISGNIQNNDIPFFMPNWTKSRNVLKFFMVIIFFLCVINVFFFGKNLVSFWNQKVKKIYHWKKKVYHVLNLFRNVSLNFKKKSPQCEW